MLYLCMLVALQQPAPSTPSGVTVVPPAPQADTQPAEPAVTYDQGPLRAEILAMFDARYFFLEKTAGTRESELRLQMRFAGAGIENTVRVGNIIFTEATDDTGRALVTPETYTEEQKNRDATVQSAGRAAQGQRTDASGEARLAGPGGANDAPARLAAHCHGARKA